VNGFCVAKRTRNDTLLPDAIVVVGSVVIQTAALVTDRDSLAVPVFELVD
jgi:hypothetical protein